MGWKRVIIYILKKVVRLTTLLFAVSLLSFILVSYSPIDPVQSYIGAEAQISPEQRDNIANYWGLHESKGKQFLLWLKAILQGDLGSSLLFRSPVATVIGERFLASFVLMSVAWVLSGLFGFSLGIVAGMVAGTWIDRIIKGYCFIFASTPAFWLGLLFLMLFSVSLGWFPVGLGTPAGVISSEVSLLEKIKHLLLPAITLSVVGVANVALHTREKLIEILQSEFIYFAKAKGEYGISLLVRHGFRNISLPALSIHFASFGELFGGAVLAELVFSYPGLGQAVVKAGLGGDVPLLLGIVLFSTMFVFTGNLIADLLYKVIDPRMRRGISNGQ